MRRAHMFWFVTLLMPMVCAGSLAAQVPSQIPTLIGDRLGRVTPTEQAVRHQRARLNGAAVASLQELARTARLNPLGVTISITFNLFPATAGRAATTFEGVIDSVAVINGGAILSKGRLTGVRDGWFTILQHAGLLSVRIYTPEANYSVFPIEDGVYLVEQEDPGLEFRDRVVPPDTVPLAEPSPTGAQAVPQEDGSRVDVLVVYSPSARQYVGGSAQMELGIRDMEQFTNLALRNSLTNTQIRVVGIREVSSSVGAELADLAFNSSGAPVRQLRATYKADLVMMIRTGGANAGIAYMTCSLNSPSYYKARAFGTVRADYLRRIYTFSHELGHIFGAGHDPNNQDACTLYDDSFGHYFSGYATILSYVNAGNRVAHYSNPAVTYRGIPTGTSTRNNARAIRASRVQLSNYYVATSTPVPGPVIAVISPADGAQSKTSSPIVIDARITDSRGVASAELNWQKTGDTMACPGGNQSYWSCILNQDRFVWTIFLGTDTVDRRYTISASNDAGGRTTSPVRTIRVIGSTSHSVDTGVGP